MSLLTAWGYALTELNDLPPILSDSEYDEYTAHKYGTDERVNPNLSAAEMAIRNACGWHVCPSLACKMSTHLMDKRVTRAGRMIMVQLPATFVSEITSVKIGATTYTTYVLETNGILRIYDVDWCGILPYTTIEVEYTAGIPDNMAAALKELIAHRVTHALASSNGVQSETAGGVSITYSANWINNSRSTALADDNMAVLSPYILKGVF